MNLTIMEPEQANKTQESVGFPVAVSLPREDADRLRKSNQSVADVANFLVGEHARGGIMLAADRVHYIQTFCSSAVRTSADVMAVIENAVQRRSFDGSLCIQYSVDPSLAAPLEELARSNGRTVDSLVHEALDIVLTNSWLYQLEPSGCTLHLTMEQRKEIEDITGKEINNGETIMKVIRKLKADLQKKEQREKRADANS